MNKYENLIGSLVRDVIDDYLYIVIPTDSSMLHAVPDLLLTFPGGVQRIRSISCNFYDYLATNDSSDGRFVILVPGMKQ